MAHQPSGGKRAPARGSKPHRVCCIFCRRHLKQPGKLDQHIGTVECLYEQRKLRRAKLLGPRRP